MTGEIEKAREELSKKIREKLEDTSRPVRGRIRYYTDRFTEYAL
jgi:hypothetical protein